VRKSENPPQYRPRWVPEKESPRDEQTALVIIVEGMGEGVVEKWEPRRIK
jgi:hypothetical protein